jgi:hypothetical protein
LFWFVQQSFLPPSFFIFYYSVFYVEHNALE